MANNEKEIWKSHPDISGIEVSSLGRVRTLDRMALCGVNRTRLVKGRILKPSNDKDGYLIVVTSIYGKKITKKVHRLVAQTFIPNPHGFPMINHKDCNRANNNVENLEWCDNSYNVQYREKFGEAQNKPIFAINLTTLKVSHFYSQREASREFGVHSGSISAVIRGKRKRAGNFWFVNDDDKADDAIKHKLNDLQSQVLGL